ncbi:hypothetical protein Plav_2213 [Parvibaculum lavamentivorans DS-1]|uniref:HPt domain-containing protein n=1 Tax=Parvibaculum lavamentivorans (strain DS-1 / DSM 13023 / NCIMB 13966) TaxID=402881 RepID=A7HV94_PARL1|nr:hypothetical protein [Parvibaculum lavamentivorans]ABS63827.1 hypothetical protein Plav_2213 [Parvibaculum lavamentivorans DS-1]
MIERRTPSKLAGSEGLEDTPPAVKFVRVPSIAERKLGSDYVAPMRLDPRVLEQMQETIKGLGTRYAESLKAEAAMLQVLVEAGCRNDGGARGRLYSIVHDMRGLAGTFGHSMVGRFADSLCGYLEKSELVDWKEGTVIRFHIDAIRDALENPGTDPAIALETLHALERLVETAAREARSVG